MRKVIWAVDPYQTKVEKLAHDARVIAGWLGKDGHVQIRPVFVLTSGVRLLPFGSFRELLPELKAEAKSKLARLWALVSHEAIAKPKLLINASDHVESIADDLLRYAKTQNAELIALKTQAKRGLARIFLGSLAETLLKRAELPILVLSPKVTAHAMAGAQTGAQRSAQIHVLPDKRLRRVA